MKRDRKYREPRVVSPGRICHVCGAEALLGGDDPLCQAHLGERPPPPRNASVFAAAWELMQQRKIKLPLLLPDAVDALIDDESLSDACAMLLAAETVCLGEATKAEAADMHNVPLPVFVYAYRRYGRSKRAACLLHPRSCAFCEAPRATGGA